LRELNECVKKCRLEIKEATKRFAGRPEREILSEKIKLCIELLHKTTSIVSKSCPKAGEIFRSTIHYIYPTPNVQESYGNMRQKFSKEWKHMMKNEKEMVLERQAAGAPDILHHKAEVERVPFALLAERLKSYKRSLKNRLTWISGKRNHNTGNFKARFSVMARVVRRWKERTQWILFNWWRNTAKHARARRRAFNRFVKERKQDVDLNKKKLYFHNWTRCILRKKLLASQEELLELQEERMHMHDRRTNVESLLEAQIHAMERRTNKQEEAEAEEKEARQRLNQRQKEVLHEKGQSEECSKEKAVLIVSLIRLVVDSLRFVQDTLSHINERDLQDPMILLGKPPYNLSFPTLFKLSKPMCGVERRLIEERRKKQAALVEKAQKDAAKGSGSRRKSIRKSKLLRRRSTMTSTTRKQKKKQAQQKESDSKRKDSMLSQRSNDTTDCDSTLTSPSRSTLGSPANSEVWSQSNVNLLAALEPFSRANSTEDLASSAAASDKEFTEAVRKAIDDKYRLELDPGLPASIRNEKIRAKLEDIARQDNRDEVRAQQHYEAEVLALEEKRDEMLRRAKNIYRDMSDQQLVLLWVNYHVARSQRMQHQKREGFRVKMEEARKATNFSSDFQDVELLNRLLNELFSDVAPLSILGSVDLFQRATRIKDALNGIENHGDDAVFGVRIKTDHNKAMEEKEEEEGFRLGDMIEVDKFLQGDSPERVFILLLKLMAEYPSLEVENINAHSSLNKQTERWVNIAKTFANTDHDVFSKMRMVSEMNHEMIALIYASEMYVRDLEKRHSMWTEFLLPRVQKCALSVLQKYMKGEPIILRNLSLEREQIRHTTLHEEKKDPLCPIPAVHAYLNVSSNNMRHYSTADRQSILTKKILESEQIFRVHLEQLRGVHRHYSQTDEFGEGTLTMNLAEFWSFLKDAGFTTVFRLAKKEMKISIRSGTLLRIFCHVAQCDEHADDEEQLAKIMELSGKPVEEAEFIHDYELDLRLFLQALLIIAVKCAGSNIQQLGVYLERLVKMVLKNTLSFQSADFRRDVLQLEVSRLFHRYRKYTLRVFYTYSISITSSLPEDLKEDKDKAHSTGMWKDTIDFQEFFKFCSDADIVDNNRLNKKQLYYIFSGVQQEGANDYDSSELSYPEFLEALAALAVYFRPLPYETVLQRIEKFLRNNIVPWVRKSLVIR